MSIYTDTPIAVSLSKARCKVNPAQQEQLINVGAYLREIRKEQGTTIDEVANQIFIRPALVAAIETGDWESLPEPVFVQGFIRRYAEYLGLDGQEVARKFEPTPVAVLPDPKLASSGTVEGVVKQQDKHGLKVLSKAEPATNGRSAAPAPSAPPKWNWILGIVGIVAIAGLIIWLTTRNTPQPTTESPDAGVEAPVDTTDDAQPEANDTVSEVAPEPTEVAPAPDDVTFAVNLEEDAWMRITVDGEVAYEGILTAGSEESWTAEEELVITAGNSGGVLFSVNGSEEQPLGEPGQVRDLVLTPDTDLDALLSP